MVGKVVTQQQARYALHSHKIKERFDSLGVIYKGLPQTGSLISVNPASTASSYFYHSDHLGSSSLITDGTGALVQHIEYVPFGETFIDERNGNWSTPFLFNGKEKDEETGLHYYGARYYDSRLGVWLSVDPLGEKKPWMTSYHYCSNNPMNRIDPDGRDDIFSSSGRFLYKTPEGNNIRIQKGKSLLLPSQTGNSLSNRALMRIVFHYVDQKGYIGTFGVDGSENDNRLGYIEPANGTVRILRNQFLSGAFDNYNNLVSVLEHEGDPGFGHKSELEKLYSKFYQFFDHAFVYYSQASSETFKNTTDEFKLGVAYSFAVRLSNALTNKEISNDEHQKFINMFKAVTGISIYIDYKNGQISLKYNNQFYRNVNKKLNNPRE